MDYSEVIIKEYDEMADRRVATVCRINIAFMVIVGLLNILGIFIIDMKMLIIAVISSIAIYLAPTIIYNMAGIHNGWVRYVILFLLVLLAGIQYAILSYHVILMMSFPLVIACLYSGKRYVIYVSTLTVLMLVGSHIAAYKLGVVPDEPLVTLKGTILYGILPRLIEMLAFIVAAYFIADRMQVLVGRVILKNKELYADQENTLTSLSEIIESQSEHTGTHVKRVALYTDIICKGLGMSDEESWKVSQASKMHDVGKIIVPLEILEKPGKLTPEEFEIVKKHTDYGKKMLENSPGELMQLGAVIAYQHHERWDGTGYHGMKGEEIHTAARCVALADVFDALVSRRPYKEAWSLEKVKEEIAAQRGRQFAPDVVDAFLREFDKFKKICESVEPDDTENEL